MSVVERYPFSAAPVYPPELSARGKEGKVDATYDVDATGRVDMTTIMECRYLGGPTEEETAEHWA